MAKGRESVTVVKLADGGAIVYLNRAALINIASQMVSVPGLVAEPKTSYERLVDELVRVADGVAGVQVEKYKEVE